MNILIYGMTEIGCLIASGLHHQHNVTLLHDENEDLYEKFTNLDISIVEGGGGDLAVLETIEAAKAGLFIACSSLDEANVFACWTNRLSITLSN